jgi:hypothetical protein
VSPHRYRPAAGAAGSAPRATTRAASAYVKLVAQLQRLDKDRLGVCTLLAAPKQDETSPDGMPVRRDGTI